MTEKTHYEVRIAGTTVHWNEDKHEAMRYAERESMRFTKSIVEVSEVTTSMLVKFLPLPEPPND